MAFWWSQGSDEPKSLQKSTQKSKQKSQYLDCESYIQALFLVISVNKPHLYANDITINQFSCTEENG